MVTKRRGRVAPVVAGWLDWEGSPLVVADHLVDLLDGQEPAPGIPALGLIAQAVEPLVGAAHQGPLVALRPRMGWGADPAPAPAATWQDGRSPEAVVHERIVGEDTSLRPVAPANEGLQHMPAQAPTVGVAPQRAKTGLAAMAVNRCPPLASLVGATKRAVWADEGGPRPQATAQASRSDPAPLRWSRRRSSHRPLPAEGDST
ncbi:hypothetical protein [Candidatus Thiodictyon syntrophicum]|jgi:hypothetical protein|uniref:Uncharacterized protein n=1 Tax=Candidatus Thiodictyon syntrophicum TaxID=1166950 RepID=A0A2K8U2Z7_9GAMM|nr:hypothetical protein [Candidatus Thiodictyon syntrophicum]AUB79958.1 hypothetical protein THSYN_02590 [Candidatus Thiodictyon syntrophicum]